MRFLKRSRTDADPLPVRIDAFWVWWATVRDEIATAIGHGALDRWVEPISRQVDALDRRLAWELNAGSDARHALIVTPEGDPAVRPIALTWHDAAPPADDVWEYHAARQPGPSATLRIGELDVDLADFRAVTSWDEARERVDVRLWHPIASAAPGDAGLRAAFLFLDNLLGEEAVERWIGTIDLLPEAISGQTPDELAAEIRRRAGSATGGTWSLGTGAYGGQDAIVAVNLSIKPIDHPFCQHHLTVTVARGTEHLAGTGEAEAERVNAAEDVLAERLVGLGGVHLGHVTRRKDRIFQFMVPDPHSARASAEAWATEHAMWHPKVSVTSDPSWKVRDELGL
jgi:hypothetical protein